MRLAMVDWCTAGFQFLGLPCKTKPPEKLAGERIIGQRYAVTAG